MAPLAGAQQAAKVARVGFLANSDRSTLAEYVDAFRQGIRELGYREGHNLVIEYRYAEGRYVRLPAFAADLVRLKVDAIVTAGSDATQAAKNASRSVPVVMALVGDPVGSGFVQSLARPGANVTGLTTLSLDLVGKHLELLKEIVPGLVRVAVLWNPDHPAHPRAIQGINASARALGLELQLVEVRNLAELDKGFADLARNRPGALAAVSDSMYDSQQTRIADFAVQNRLPAAYTKAFAGVGGLISYGARFPDLFRRAAMYVDKILKGARPADLPVEQPTKFELIINLKTAKALGVAIPQSVMLRADEIIQ